MTSGVMMAQCDSAFTMEWKLSALFDECCKACSHVLGSRDQTYWVVDDVMPLSGPSRCFPQATFMCVFTIDSEWSENLRGSVLTTVVAFILAEHRCISSAAPFMCVAAVRSICSPAAATCCWNQEASRPPGVCCSGFVLKPRAATARLKSPSLQQAAPASSSWY